jgi:hypothetical protein
VEVINSVNAILAVQPPPAATASTLANKGRVGMPGGAWKPVQSATGNRNNVGKSEKDADNEGAADDLRACACEMLAACLEGRHDGATHDAMRRRIEPVKTAVLMWFGSTNISEFS